MRKRQRERERVRKRVITRETERRALVRGLRLLFAGLCVFVKKKIKKRKVSWELSSRTKMLHCVGGTETKKREE